jgi:hypothetical protein
LQGNGSSLAINSATVEQKTWEYIDPLSAGSGYGDGSASSMEYKINVFTIEFNTDLAFLLTMPDVPTLRRMAPWSFPEAAIQMLVAWNNTEQPLSSFEDNKIPQSTYMDYYGGSDLLSALANEFRAGIDVRIDCGQGPLRQDEVLLIPPAQNPVPAFLENMLGSGSGMGSGSGGSSMIKLFSNATWRHNTLVFAHVQSSCMPEYGWCPPPLDLGSCTVTVGDLQASFEQKSAPCTVEQLKKFSDIVDPFMETMDQAKTVQQFSSMITSLSVLKMMDAFTSCTSLLESMLTTKEEVSWLPGQRW